MAPQVLEALGSGATVVTPNRRLARALKAAFDRSRQQTGAEVWTAADVLPWSAWLDRTFEALIRDEPGVRVLAPAQELALWQRAVADSAAAHALLDTAATARIAREAAQLDRAWRLDLRNSGAPLHDDARAFVGWAARYRALCDGGAWVDGAAVPDEVAARMDPVRASKIGRVIAYGFDALTPQQRALLAAMRSAGVKVEEMAPAGMQGAVVRRTFATPADELGGVALQVRTLLQADPRLAIGIVVPELSQRRADVMRTFDDALEPARVLAAGSAAPRPWNVSLGTPLAATALVHAALTILRFARGSLEAPDIGLLLRSPFVVAAEQERAARALLDARLRRIGRLRFDIGAVQREAFARDREQPHACRVLAARLDAWQPAARDAQRLRQLPSAWSTTLVELLGGLGWPGERALDSDEFQAWEAWRAVVAGLAALDPVLGSLRYDDALSWLTRLSSDTLFQPESADVTIQVLGTLESAGLEFDHLFVTGLQDQAWPPPARPNPLLPIALQRRHGVPHADAQWELGFARRMMGQWRVGARTLHVSCAERDGDRVLRPSALISALEVEPGNASSKTYPARMHEAACLESFTDIVAPALAPGYEVGGGAGVFENQSACPFRAFARHRLGARRLDEVRAGLDPRERGTLLHRTAAHLWGEIESQAQLLSMDDAKTDAAVGRAADAALAVLARDRPDALSPAFVAIERERLGELMTKLLALERRRAPFRVAQREAPRSVSVGGLVLRARVDRIDVLEDGRHVVIDYKTGPAMPAHWLGDRPDAPQLPLYAVTDAGEVAAVAFAAVNAREAVFRGLASEPGLLPGVDTVDGMGAAATPIDGWHGLFTLWRRMLDALAAEFLAGHAPVAPKQYPQTCRYCELGALCRVREQVDAAVDMDEGDADD
jgi:probable DNA repair protein